MSRKHVITIDRTETVEGYRPTHVTVRVTQCTDTGEFRARLTPPSREVDTECDYFTDDRADAIGTARHMAEQCLTMCRND